MSLPFRDDARLPRQLGGVRLMKQSRLGPNWFLRHLARRSAQPAIGERVGCAAGFPRRAASPASRQARGREWQARRCLDDGGQAGVEREQSRAPRRLGQYCFEALEPERGCFVSGFEPPMPRCVPPGFRQQRQPQHGRSCRWSFPRRLPGWRRISNCPPRIRSSISAACRARTPDRCGMGGRG